MLKLREAIRPSASRIEGPAGGLSDPSGPLVGHIASLVGRASIRHRLLVVILLAIAPLLLLLAYEIGTDFRETTTRTRERVQAAAELAASHQSRAFLESRVFLETLRSSPPQLLAGGSECSENLARLREANPQFNSIGIVDRDQNVVCHSSLSTPRAYDGPSIFERATSGDGEAFVVGGFTHGPATARPTLAMAMALPNSVGGGLVYVGYDLERLLLTRQNLHLGLPSVVSILDEGSGRFIAYGGAGRVDLTPAMTDHPLARAIGGGEPYGVTDAVGLDGAERIYGYASIPAPDATSFVLSVGVFGKHALAPVYVRSLQATALAVGVSLLACITTWWVGSWTHIQPIRKLGDMARRVGGGDLDARVAISDWHAPEFRRLATKVNIMAERLLAVRDAEQAAAARDAIYKLLAENTADVVVRLDEAGICSFASPSAREVFGTDPAGMLGTGPAAVSVPEDRGIVTAMVAALQAGEAVSDVRFRARHPGGQSVWVEVTARPLAEGGGVLVMRDVTRRKAMEEDLKEANSRLEVLAFKDALTGLTNRRAFDEQFDAEFKRARREKTDLSLVLFDIDRFKHYNDTYGHVAGDECLRLVGRVFRQSLKRPGDVGARYGGEEFAAILPNTSSAGAVDRAEAIRIAIRGLQLENRGSEFGIVTASLGIATMPGGSGYRDAEEMVEEADRELYRAKEEGRDAVRGHDPERPIG